MKVVLLTSLLILLSTQMVFLQTVDIDSLIKQGIEQSICHAYDQAENTFALIIKLEQNHPVGYFFMAASLQSKMMDYETDEWELKFFSFLDETEHRAKELIQRNDHNAWAHFYLGSAHSYRAFYDGRNKNYVSAIRNGLAGIYALKKAVDIDSSIYDSYFGLGSYKYWRSRFTKYLNWLPLINDERELGIKMIKLAAQKGKYTHHAAINELVWILIDAGRVTDALKWAKLGSQKYPQSRFFMWGIAKCYFNLNQFNKALEYYQIILNSIRQEPFNNHYNEIICYYKIAHCHFHLEQYDSALAVCTDIFKIDISSEVSERLHVIFNDIHRLRKTIIQKKRSK